MLSEVTAALRPRVAGEAAQRALNLDQAWADHSGRSGEARLAIDGKSATGWSMADGQDANVARTAIFFVDGADRFPAASELVLMLEQHHERPGYLIGRLRVSVTDAPRDFVSLPAAAREALAVAPAQRNPEQIKQLRAEYQKIDPERVPLAKRIGELKQSYEQMRRSITTTLILREREQPRTTHIHVRGDFLHAGALVSPGVPAVLPPIQPRGERVDRLDLARWLVDPRHPLTARVVANRIWQSYFGQGLVATENDFGLQGERPTHPELLDWLAGQFVEQAWSQKALHRLIVRSATYRQSSGMRPELSAADPLNRLIGRQQRLRLEAETIRDAALAASGLLSRDVGGPGVYPPQPEGIYRFTQQVKFWGESRDGDRYRRGMYTYLWRSSPYPFLKTFDVPDAVVACTRRPRSNTPLQALTLANDRAFYEIAQGFSRTIISGEPVDDEARIRSAFKRCFAREPSDQERSTLRGYVEAQRLHFAAAPEQAERVLPGELPPGIDRPQAAAWTMLARVLLNLDEFITRE